MSVVLIIEDDHDCRISIQQVLEGEGHEVLTAENGLDGLDLLHGLTGHCIPDLVILDLMMPLFDGWAFLQAKGTDALVAPIPVIVMTAMNANQARAKTLDGALFIIRKPYSLEHLLKAVNRAVSPQPTER